MRLAIIRGASVDRLGARGSASMDRTQSSKSSRGQEGVGWLATARAARAPAGGRTRGSGKLVVTSTARSSLVFVTASLSDPPAARRAARAALIRAVVDSLCRQSTQLQIQKASDGRAAAHRLRASRRPALGECSRATRAASRWNAADRPGSIARSTINTSSARSAKRVGWHQASLGAGCQLIRSDHGRAAA